MQITTTRNREKPFSWSYSKLKNYETCPSRYYHVDVRKTFKEDDDNENLKWGNMVHAALAKRLHEDVPLPKGMQEYEKWCARIRAGSGYQLLVEQKLAIDSNFGASSWFGDGAWYRGVADAIKVVGPVALVVDWKTGKIIEDSVQLALMAACVFAHHPQVEKLRAEFIWLKEDATTRLDIARSDMPKFWSSTLPRVAQLEHAHKTTAFPAKPSGLCKRFCVVSSCPHHGVG
jgi:hypothetical protein